MSKGINSHGKGKHIDIKYRYVQDVVNSGKIKVVYCPTSEMLADIPAERFARLRFLIGVRSIS